MARLGSSICLIPLEGVEDEEQEGGSRSNLSKLHAFTIWFKALLLPGDVLASDVGLITPYSGQGLRALVTFSIATKDGTRRSVWS